MPFLQTVRDYIYLMKLKITSLLVFTSAMTLFLAAVLNSVTISLPFVIYAITIITLGCGGCNTLTCYIDRDIDAIMDRTKDRPLPSHRIQPASKALIFGLVLLSLSLAGAFLINALSFLMIFIGFLDNVIVYSLILKRRNPLNIILGGLSGGMPALFGWTAVMNGLTLLPIILAIMIMLWIPNHIWNLAIYYKNDYRKAGVPMLPVVVNMENSVRLIVLSVIIMFPLSLLPYFLSLGLGLVYLVVAVGFGAIIVAGNIYAFFRPTVDHAWTMFKLSSPYLFLLFTAMVVDAIMK